MGGAGKKKALLVECLRVWSVGSMDGFCGRCGSISDCGSGLKAVPLLARLKAVSERGKGASAAMVVRFEERTSTTHSDG